MTKRRKFEINPVEMPELGEVDREILKKTTDDGVYPLSMAKKIRLDRIKPDPNQPRTSYDTEGIDDLAASIKEQGVLNPIGVQYVRQEDCFMIIHGERRWQAAKMAGLETIPAIIQDIDTEERLVQQLIENIQREDLNPVDRGRALKRVRGKLELTSWKAVGEKIGVSRVRVHQLLATVEFPQEIQEDLRAGNISEKKSRIYTGLPAPHQIALHWARKEKELTDEEVSQVAHILKDNPHQESGEVIRRIKSRRESATRSSANQKKSGYGISIRSIAKVNRRLQRALPDLAVDELSVDERDEFKSNLKALQTLIEKFLTQLG